MEAIMLSNKRTGSTFLQEAIDSHPDISAFDEMFMVSTNLIERRGYKLYKTLYRERGLTEGEYLDWIKDKDKNTIFRLVYNQCDYWNMLQIVRNRRMSVIHLRRNPIDIVISLFCKFKHIKPEDTVSIDESEFKDKIHRHVNLLRKYDKEMSEYGNVITVNYENMFGRRRGKRRNLELVGTFNVRSEQVTYLDKRVNKEICNMFGVENVRMFSNVTKKFTLPREKKISNWNKIRKIIENDRKLSGYL